MFRSAITGRFVTAAYAAKHPHTTMRHRRRRSARSTRFRGRRRRR